MYVLQYTMAENIICLFRLRSSAVAIDVTENCSTPNTLLVIYRFRMKVVNLTTDDDIP